MTAYEQLMADLVGEPEEVVLATFDAAAEMEVSTEEPVWDWIYDSKAAEKAIAEIMRR